MGGIFIALRLYFKSASRALFCDDFSGKGDWEPLGSKFSVLTGERGGAYSPTILIGEDMGEWGREFMEIGKVLKFE